MPTSKLRKVGGSTMLAIPPNMLEALHLSAPASVELSLRRGMLVMRPARRRYELAQLLAETDATTAPSNDDRAWLDAPPMGREL